VAWQQGHSSISSVIVIVIILAHPVESYLNGYLHDQLVVGLNHQLQGWVLLL
jgi:hypothetical protein